LRATLLPAAALLAAGMAHAAPCAATGTAGGSGLSQAEIQALDPPIASCVIANLDAAYTAAAARLLVQACTRLVAAGAASPGGDDQLFVKCKVAGDPEWIEFRLVTRRQCANAAGRIER